MLTGTYEKIQERIKVAHAEATWIVAEIAEKLLAIRKKTLKEPEFDDPIQAAVHYSNPEFGYSHEFVQQKIAEAAWRGVQSNSEGMATWSRVGSRRTVRNVWTP